MRETAGICGGEVTEEEPLLDTITGERFEEDPEEVEVTEVTEDPKGDKEGGGGANPEGETGPGVREGGDATVD